MRVQGAPVGVQEGFDARDAGLSLGKVKNAVAVAWSSGQHNVHAAGAHVEGAFVGVKAVARVPIDAVNAEPQSYQEDQ